MSEAPHAATDAQTDEITLEYGDQFEHKITGDVYTVHDVRDGERKVLFTNGGFDWKGELKAAVRGEPSMYEPYNCNNSWD